jgi:hypothetical protein
MHRISVYSRHKYSVKFLKKENWNWIRTVSQPDIRVLIHGGIRILDNLKIKTGHSAL